MVRFKAGLLVSLQQMPNKDKTVCPRCGLRVWRLIRHLRITHRMKEQRAVSMAGDVVYERRRVRRYTLQDGNKRCPFCSKRYGNMLVHFRRNHSDVSKRKGTKGLRRLRGKDVSSSSEEDREDQGRLSNAFQ